MATVTSTSSPLRGSLARSRGGAIRGRAKGEWKKQTVDSGFNTEFSFLVDLDNDGKARELLPQFGGAKSITAWYEVRDGKWVQRQVSDRGYGHGIGAGDLNGDKRTDILTPQGWSKRPPIRALARGSGTPIGALRKASGSCTSTT